MARRDQRRRHVVVAGGVAAVLVAVGALLVRFGAPDVTPTDHRPEQVSVEEAPPGAPSTAAGEGAEPLAAPAPDEPGAVAAAQHAGVPIIAAGARTTSAWYLRSWDRMCIPKPFAVIDVEYSEPIRIAPGKDGLREGIAAVQRALHAVTGTTEPR